MALAEPYIKDHLDRLEITKHITDTMDTCHLMELALWIRGERMNYSERYGASGRKKTRSPSFVKIKRNFM